jgi:hypothetical protein
MSGTINKGTIKLDGVGTDYFFPDPVGTIVELTTLKVGGVQTDYYRGPAPGSVIELTLDTNGIPTSYFVPNATGFGSVGAFYTVDTTGTTVDSILITVDKTIV